MRRTCIFLFIVFSLATTLSATPVTPSSYDILSSTYLYSDSTGSQLTDGHLQPILPGLSLCAGGCTQWVGWSNNDPLISFHFATSTRVTSITLDVANWGPAAVYVPAQVDVDSNPAHLAGIASDLSWYLIDERCQCYVGRSEVTFTGNWVGQDLDLLVHRPNPTLYDWTLIDEVSFDGTRVPEGGSSLAYLAVAALAVALIARHNSMLA